MTLCVGGLHKAMWLFAQLKQSLKCTSKRQTRAALGPESSLGKEKVLWDSQQCRLASGRRTWAMLIWIETRFASRSSAFWSRSLSSRRAEALGTAQSSPILMYVAQSRREFHGGRRNVCFAVKREYVFCLYSICRPRSHLFYETWMESLWREHEIIMCGNDLIGFGWRPKCQRLIIKF